MMGPTGEHTCGRRLGAWEGRAARSGRARPARGGATRPPSSAARHRPRCTSADCHQPPLRSLQIAPWVVATCCGRADVPLKAWWRGIGGAGVAQASVARIRPDTSIQAPLGATSAQRRLRELRAGLAPLQVGLATVGGTAGFEESAAPPSRRCAAAGLSRFAAVFLTKTRDGETSTPSRSVLSAAPRQTLRNEGSIFERPAF
jgi:hypothetical protein